MIISPSAKNICHTCGVRYGTSIIPTMCEICADDRQFPGFTGQIWTSYNELAAKSSIRFSRLQSTIYDLRITPAFAIAQKAHLVLSSSGNVLWDCLPFIDDQTIAFIRSLGGIRAIAISHPHYYSLMQDWATAFDCPIYLHANDREWVKDPGGYIESWSGSIKTLWDNISIVHVGGHFPGSTILHLPDHGRAGCLLTGDSIYVAPSRRHMAFMYSYPNHIPLPKKDIELIYERVHPLPFDAMYGAFEWMNIAEGARALFERSISRYLSTY